MKAHFTFPNNGEYGDSYNFALSTANTIMMSVRRAVTSRYTRINLV